MNIGTKLQGLLDVKDDVLQVPNSPWHKTCLRGPCAADALCANIIPNPRRLDVRAQRGRMAANALALNTRDHLAASGCV